MVIELETGINNKAKFEYCTNQVRRYREIKFATKKPVRFIILFDEENTSEKFGSVSSSVKIHLQRI